MLTDRIESKWIDAFKNQFALCAIQPGDTVAILSESQSRALNVHLSELALGLLGARVFHLVVPTPRQTAPVPVRSTGASQAVGNLAPVVAALASSTMVVDVTVEGLLHAPELPQILKGGARVMMVSNEHPEVLERLPSDPALQPKVRAGL
jgi:2,5-dihydroxypyridine 5,6-dioxygenase